ncbi:MAG: FG-GAP-like repeat-containing protein, partial [Nocardioidaceae bacterium]
RGSVRPAAAGGRAGLAPRGDLAALSAPTPVGGLATVGVTWPARTRVPDGGLSLSLRTRSGGGWSAWTPLPLHDEEAPDVGSAEGRSARPGTDPVYVGSVERLQVRAVTDSGRAPAGLRLDLVDPGASGAARREVPRIDTGAAGAGPAAEARVGAAALVAAKVTTRPRIYSRRQWGADDRLRDRSSLRYGEVHAGFVHHTVNANRYSRAQVPAVLRGIYAYHTQARGWSDIGYNVLVDRFGRLWEGRAGGVNRPVVGAHTRGYNDDAFAVSAIGDFERSRPTAAMLAGFARLFAWKLALHGIRAGSSRQLVAGRRLRAVVGHRDVGQTACPGRYLYARIPTIRSLAARHQRAWTARGRSANLVGGRTPELVVRDRSSKRLFLVRTARGRAVRVAPTTTVLPRANALLTVGDWDGDGRGDLVARQRGTGQMFLHRGNGRGRFAAPVRMSRADFGAVRLLAAVGDVTGDGRPDLMGQPRGKAMRVFPGNGRRGFRSGYVVHSAFGAVQHLGVGLWTADGAPDSVLRTASGRLWLFPGNGPGGLTDGRRIGSLGRTYDWALSPGDLTGDGRPDLVVRARATKKAWLLPGTGRGLGVRHGFARSLARFDLAG